MSPLDPVESSDGGDHWGFLTSTVFVVYNFAHKNNFVKEKLDLM